MLDQLLETEPSEISQGDTPRDDDSADALRSSGFR
jgi:hypothetical protein